MRFDMPQQRGAEVGEGRFAGVPDLIFGDAARIAVAVLLGAQGLHPLDVHVAAEQAGAALETSAFGYQGAVFIYQ